MSTDSNKAVASCLIDEGINKGNLGVIEEVVAADCLSREDDSLHRLGVEGFKEIVMTFRTAFQDAHLTLEGVVAEGNLVVTWASFSGTHLGPLEELAPTSRRVKVSDVDLYRLRDGKVVETWAHFDQAGMMRQLGVGAG